jgi:hypothetical protein
LGDNVETGVATATPETTVVSAAKLGQVTEARAPMIKTFKNLLE